MVVAMFRRLVALALLLGCVGCRVERVDHERGRASADCGEAPTGEVTVYTSLYRPIIERVDAEVKRSLPGVTVRWYAAGSEKVAARIDAERASGGVQADLLLTSDPFFYRRLADDGAFAPVAPLGALRVPRSLVDPDGRFIGARVSSMVLAYRDATPAPARRFSALTDPALRGRVAIGDPLTSGTAFTWAVFMAQRHGISWFAALRQNGAVVAGGNAAVQQKLETGEADIAVLLLENVIAARARGVAISAVVPEDGVVTIPGYAALFTSAQNPVAARAVYELLLSEPLQRAMVEVGAMHAVDPRISGPGATAPIDAWMARGLPWTDETFRLAPSVKEAFTEAFAR